ncbi:MAG: FAD-binding oxidoreductase [Acidobacteriota bacterium]
MSRCCGILREEIMMADRSTEPDPTRLEGWGRHPAVEAPERVSEDLERSTDGASLARGMGRSYGDASLPLPGGVAVGTRLGDRVLAFDESTGVLHAEAGLTLHALTWLFLPRGWSSPTLPGTAYITLGGMVAADVHGKEHHVRGTFGRHVERLKIRLADGRVVWTGRDDDADLFCATLGGMGLTGHILEVVVRLHRVPSPWVVQETERHPNLASFVDGLAQAAESWEFTMGWIDCLKRGPSMGRGILFRGRWADPERGDALPTAPPTKKIRLSVPVDVPSFLLNKLSVAIFNETLYRKHGEATTYGIVHPEEFFHPLDKILHWNRGYGGPGFTQYQCVVPTRDGARRVLEELTRRGAASFLCVLKDCGDEGEGLLSFPRPGTSIAVDLPVRRDTADIVAQLNRQVIAEGGRIYLAKDTFTTAVDFRAMERERLERFLAVRRRVDPDGRLSSVLSRRLFGD